MAVNPIRVNRCLEWTYEDVIRFKHPMHQNGLIGDPVVATVYNGTVTDEMADIRHYSVDNIAKFGSRETNQIIGWSPSLVGDFKPLLFKQTADLFVTRNDYQFMNSKAMEVFTDTIFPVLTLKDSKPFGYVVKIQDEIDQSFRDIDGEVRYDTCIQLVLMDPMAKHTVMHVKAEVTCKLPNNFLLPTTKTLDGYQADLRLFHSNPDTTSLVSQAVIEYILDKQDPNCSLVGLYAGPDLPPPQYRQCWPIYKPDSKPQHITREQESPLRHSAHKKFFIRRVGYLVSKQSLLCVCERQSRRSPDHTQHIFNVKDDKHYYTGLLKDNTFCISDSRHTLLNKKHQAYEEINFSPYFIPFNPKIVVLPEGLNSLVIHDVRTIYKRQDGNDFDYTVSQLSGQRLSVQQILCLDWCQFQRDFEGEGEYIGPRFTAGGKLSYIQDNCTFINYQLGVNVCFSLTKSMKYGDYYEERYNVYAELLPGAGTAQNEFRYIQSIAFIWIIDKTRTTTNQRVYQFERGDWGAPNKFMAIDPPGETYFQDHIHWIETNMDDHMRIAYRLATKPIEKIYKLSSVSMTKMLWIRDYPMVFV